MAFNERPIADMALTNIGELVTLSGQSSKPVTFPDKKSLGVLKTPNLCVAISGSRIAFVGSKSDLSEHVSYSSSEEIDCGGQLVMPGFVDSHTHSIFAGSREDELSSKLEGATYLEILKAGGGILKTVKDTNQASDDQLLLQTKNRLDRMISFGTTTFEIKSGYSLTVSGEIRLLELLGRLRSESGYDIASTLLSAHAIPQEYSGRQGAYLHEVVIPSINVCAERGLADFCDVFLEEGVFGYKEAEMILNHAQRIGLRAKIHADEFSDQNGAHLAARLGVVSADHLGKASLDGITSLAKSNVVSVLLPGTLFSSFVGSYARARDFFDLGSAVAIATDLSPNSWIESMQFVISLACYGMRISVEEAIVASTINSAHAISRAKDIGSIEVGKKADILICNVPNYEQIPYRIASNVVEKVIKGGKVIHEN
ncbi:MAG: imidazolonepropionase [Thaumarchaeota archaeon]|nr:imidazolonepropionase [Nitrososphaerota archaeon]